MDHHDTRLGRVAACGCDTRGNRAQRQVMNPVLAKPCPSKPWLGRAGRQAKRTRSVRGPLRARGPVHPSFALLVVATLGTANAGGLEHYTLAQGELSGAQLRQAQGLHGGLSFRPTQLEARARVTDLVPQLLAVQIGGETTRGLLFSLGPQTHSGYRVELEEVVRRQSSPDSKRYTHIEARVRVYPPPLQGRRALETSPFVAARLDGVRDGEPVRWKVAYNSLGFGRVSWGAADSGSLLVADDGRASFQAGSEERPRRGRIPGPLLERLASHLAELDAAALEGADLRGKANHTLGVNGRSSRYDPLAPDGVRELLGILIQIRDELTHSRNGSTIVDGTLRFLEPEETSRMSRRRAEISSGAVTYGLGYDTSLGSPSRELHEQLNELRRLGVAELPVSMQVRVYAWHGPRSASAFPIRIRSPERVELLLQVLADERHLRTPNGHTYEAIGNRTEVLRGLAGREVTARGFPVDKDRFLLEAVEGKVSGLHMLRELRRGELTRTTEDTRSALLPGISKVWITGRSAHEGRGLLKLRTGNYAFEDKVVVGRPRSHSGILGALQR